MEATRLLVAQGRFHEVNDQVWTSFLQSQREELLSLIPVTKAFDLYAKLCPDPRYNQDWYYDRTIKIANLVGPNEALKLLDFACKSNTMLKNTMDDLLLYSKLNKHLVITYQSLSSGRAHEKKHVVDVIGRLCFPLKLADINFEPWLCVALLTGDFGSSVNSQLSAKLLLGNYDDVLFSLSELNCRQVGLNVERSGPRDLDLCILLASLKTSQAEGLYAAKAILGPVGFDIDSIEDLKDALSRIIGENQALAVSAADEHCDWSLLEPVLRSNHTGLSTVNLGLAFECLSHL